MTPTSIGVEEPTDSRYVQPPQMPRHQHFPLFAHFRRRASRGIRVTQEDPQSWTTWREADRMGTFTSVVEQGR